MKSYKETYMQIHAAIDLATKRFKLTREQQIKVLTKVAIELTLNNERVDLDFVCALRELGFDCETTAFSRVFSVESTSKSTQK